MYVMHANDNDMQHTINAEILIDKLTKPISVLLDTGALQSNYVSPEVAEWIQQHGGESVDRWTKVCGAFNCKIIKKVAERSVNH